MESFVKVKKIRLVFEGLKKYSYKVATYERSEPEEYSQFGSETATFNTLSLNFWPLKYAVLYMYKEASHYLDFSVAVFKPLTPLIPSFFLNSLFAAPNDEYVAAPFHEVIIFN